MRVASRGYLPEEVADLCGETAIVGEGLVANAAVLAGVMTVELWLEMYSKGSVQCQIGSRRSSAS